MSTTTRDAVLVIDDDPDFRELVRIYVEGEGIEVLEAADCVRGVAVLCAARERVALVLLDYWMPHMLPVQCSTRICELVRPMARVVLVTAAVDARKRAVELGLSEWLSKPFDFEHLRVLVRAAKRTQPSPTGPDAMKEETAETRSSIGLFASD